MEEGYQCWQEWGLFYYGELPNYAVREPCVAHSRAYTALIRIPLLILRREIPMKLSQLPRHSHIKFVCQLKAYPLEMKTELKPTLNRGLSSYGDAQGKNFAFFLSLQHTPFSPAFLKFTSDIYLFNPKCQNPSSLTQGPHIVGAWPVFVFCLFFAFIPRTIDLRKQPPGRAPCKHNPTVHTPQASQSDVLLPFGNMSGQHRWRC